MNKREVLRQRQSLDLEAKVNLTKKRIREWHDHWDGDVYVAFSGGKDSTVLLDLVWSMYPKVPAVFSNTGLELKQIKEFVKFTTDKGVTSIVDGKRIYRKGTIERVIPEMDFRTVTKTHGFAAVSKKTALMLRILQRGDDPKWHNTYNLHKTGYNSKGKYSSIWKLPKKYEHLIDSGVKFSEKCCDELKKKPFKRYEKKTGLRPIQGIMADEGGMRGRKETCNVFEGALKISSPMLFWKESDVWDYIKTRRLRIAKPYLTQVNDEGKILEPMDRTGCAFCMFGVHMEKGRHNRFQSLYHRDKRMWDTAVNKLGCGKVLDLIDVKYIPEDADEEDK